jgi:hypothetical protein
MLRCILQEGKPVWTADVLKKLLGGKEVAGRGTTLT